MDRLGLLLRSTVEYPKELVGEHEISSMCPRKTGQMLTTTVMYAALDG
jgi:hypothetical protein